MKYVVVVIFKNGTKLDKMYEKKDTARRAAHKIGKNIDLVYDRFYFAHTYFKFDDVLCVTWQEVEV